MTRPVSAVLAAFTLLLLAASPAGAQFDYDPAETTYDQAAADYPFPVYEPTRGIRGMGFRVSDLICADDVRYPYASYGYARDRRGTRPRFSVWQSRRRVRCGGAVPLRAVAKARIEGRVVKVRVLCHIEDACTARDGRRVGWLIDVPRRDGAGGRTTITIATDNTSLKRLLRFARGFERVDLTRPLVRMDDFTNPDKTIHCFFVHDPGTGPNGGPAQHFASCRTETPTQDALLFYDGRVVLCRDGVPFPCIQQWYVEDTHALAAGQRSRRHGFECLVEAAAVTCTIVRGAAKGRGFTISLAGASEIVPP